MKSFVKFSLPACAIAQSNGPAQMEDSQSIASAEPLLSRHLRSPATRCVPGSTMGGSTRDTTKFCSSSKPCNVDMGCIEELADSAAGPQCWDYTDCNTCVSNGCKFSGGSCGDECLTDGPCAVKRPLTLSFSGIVDRVVNTAASCSKIYDDEAKQRSCKAHRNCSECMGKDCSWFVIKGAPASDGDGYCANYQISFSSQHEVAETCTARCVPHPTYHNPNQDVKDWCAAKTKENCAVGGHCSLEMAMIGMPCTENRDCEAIVIQDGFAKCDDESKKCQATGWTPEPPVEHSKEIIVPCVTRNTEHGHMGESYP